MRKLPCRAHTLPESSDGSPFDRHELPLDAQIPVAHSHDDAIVSLREHAAHHRQAGTAGGVGIRECFARSPQ
jgi:hypothetical protein